MFENLPTIMNIEQLCEALQISKKLAYKLINEEKIKCLKIGRAYRIPQKFVWEYLDGS